MIECDSCLDSERYDEAKMFHSEIPFRLNFKNCVYINHGECEYRGDVRSSWRVQNVVQCDADYSYIDTTHVYEIQYSEAFFVNGQLNFILSAFFWLNNTIIAPNWWYIYVLGENARI